MSLYRKFVLPRLIDLSMKNKETARYRPKIVPLARGQVLEVGVGSGLNFPFYSEQVHSVCGVDSSEELLRMAEKRAGAVSGPVQLLNSSAEAIPLDSETADTIVMTWTLCSIPQPEKALAEMLRVLKPGGELLFIEHGAAPDRTVRTWQDRINPPWRALAGGCNINRQMDRLISDAGFHIVELEKGYLRGPRLFTFTYRGRARKA